MPDLTIAAGLSFTAQFVTATVMTFLLIGFYNQYRKTYVFQWMLSWAALAIGQIGIIVARWASGDLGVPPLHPFRLLPADNGVSCSMSRSGNVWDNAAMESFLSSLKTERTARKTCRTRPQAKADVFDYIERFYTPRHRHSTLGYLSPVEFERKAGLA